MIEKLSWLFLRLIALLHVGMLIWGIFGFLEYFFNFSIVPLQNPDFLKGTQFLHWLLITTSGVIFLYGFITKWSHTPTAMLVIYAMLATMCFIQTFDMMTSPNRYIAYTFEIILYIVLSVFLFHSQASKNYFTG